MNSVIREIIGKVKKTKFCIPRDYRSIGGIWTVDTYKHGSVTVQVMDEGYTTVVKAPGLKVITGFNGQEYVRFVEGDEPLASLYLENLLKEEVAV